ncbi:MULTISPECIES: ATP/GTP-binding protein [unclassified Thiocapsa]|uniref:ATP/GTP-binding protein n=1 Tax=unclassified Thiocapsa TaxID=2641286 RepID=UPI0035B449EC
MTALIRTCEVRGFRAFADLRINGLGKVNLITGKNNSGKSSLLEAIRILITGGAPGTLYEILDYREELGSANDAERLYSQTDLEPFCNLFNGFPDLARSAKGFSISAVGSLPESISRINVNINWFIRKSDPMGPSMRFEPASSDALDDVDSFPALQIQIAARTRVIPLDKFPRRYAMRPEPDVASRPCIYVDPFSSRSTSQMGALWDAITLTDADQEVVKALQVISPDIQAVTMIGSDHRNGGSRKAIAKSSLYPEPLPLRTFGDGMNRLFGVIVSLCNARNGVLLVDEIENGLHYSIQTDIWHTVFRLARDLNVQVFATSHSWDSVRAFQKAATESPEDGVLVRLSRKDGQIIPTLFTEKELEIVTRDQVEVR